MSVSGDFSRIAQAIRPPHTGAAVSASLSAGFERLQLAADPDMAAAREEWLEQESERKLDRHLARKMPGAGGGLQCKGCKTFKPLGQHVCGQCGYLDGAGYQAVPAPTNYLERWR